MARPKTDDPVQNRTIGLRRSEWEAFDEDAATAGCSTRNAFLRLVMAERRVRPPVSDLGKLQEHARAVKVAETLATARGVDPVVPVIGRGAKPKQVAKKQPLARRDVVPMFKTGKGK